MNRRLSLFPILLVAVTVFSACQRTTPDTNRDATKIANTNAAKETINPVAIEAEITRLENEWATGSQKHDANAVRKILADDLIITYPDGSTGTKSSELSGIESGALTADAWLVSDTKVTILSGDGAFITGRSVIKNGKYKDAKSKRVIDLSGEYRFTDVYARRNGQWQAVASQTTKIENPAPAPPPEPTPKASVAASPK
jgi:ketosteroid isomerase-like protein